MFYRAVPDGLTPLRDWLSFYERFWTSRLDALEGLLREDDKRSERNRKTRNRKKGDDR